MKRPVKASNNASDPKWDSLLIHQIVFFCCFFVLFFSQSTVTLHQHMIISNILSQLYMTAKTQSHDVDKVCWYLCWGQTSLWIATFSRLFQNFVVTIHYSRRNDQKCQHISQTSQKLNIPKNLPLGSNTSADICQGWKKILPYEIAFIWLIFVLGFIYIISIRPFLYFCQTACELEPIPAEFT